MPVVNPRQPEGLRFSRRPPVTGARLSRGAVDAATDVLSSLRTSREDPMNLSFTDNDELLKRYFTGGMQRKYACTNYGATR